MNLLIACLHHPTCTGRWLTRAFRRLGYDVRHIGAYPNDDASESPHAWQPMGTWDAYWHDWTPDVIVYADTVYTYWRHGSYGHVPHVNVTTCNNVCNMSSLNHDHYFVAHKNSTVWPVAGPNMTWMPCGYDPDLHVLGSKPWGQRAWDVALVGASTPKRREYIEALKEHGVSVYAATGLLWQDYVAVYHDARISLCVNDQKSPMMRYFESAAMGNLIIGDYCKDLYELTPKAEGIVAVNSATDAVFYARRYLQNPYLAQEHMGRARAWVQEHTWDARAMQIIRWVEGERVAV